MCRPQPTKRPTKAPTPRPTRWPTRSPTLRPTEWPTRKPTYRPTHPTMPNMPSEPTNVPTVVPSVDPTSWPTMWPSPSPTNKWPTDRPTEEPTGSPTTGPIEFVANSTSSTTEWPTPEPTPNPVKVPTESPSPGPTERPTSEPITAVTTEPILWSLTTTDVTTIGCPVCLADAVFVDPYLDEEKGYFAVPLPPKDVQYSAQSESINVDVGSGTDSALINDRDPITSVLMADVKGGGDSDKKIDFSTLCYIVLLLIISCNAIVCSWHVMKGERREAIMGYFKGNTITAQMSETDVSDSDSEMDEELDYYDDREDDDDEYR